MIIKGIKGEAAMSKTPLSFKRLLGDSRGMTLIEVIIIVVVLGIAVPALMSLMSSTLFHSGKSAILSQSTMFAQERIEEIIADKKSDSRGYGYVVTPGRYLSDSPASGFTRTVAVQTTGMTYNGVPYAHVEVTVSHDDIPNITLSTWLTEY
jgi:Tfp pilus assembly protein PilV